MPKRAPRRSFLVHATLVALLGVATGQALASASPVSTAGVTLRAPSDTADVRVVTYNVAAGNTVAQATKDVTKIAGTGADVIALQEMASAKKRKAVRAALIDCSMCAYEGYMPKPSVQGSTPILYRWDMFRLEETGTVQVSEATFVGAEGAGPSTLNAKFVNYVKLYERATGQSLYVLNNHAVPSVQGTDGGRNHLKARHALYDQHMTGLQELVEQLKKTGAAVLVVGDLNVNYRKDKKARDPLFPYERMGQVGVRASFQVLGETARGTVGGPARRLIDYVSSTSHPHVQPVKHRIPLGYSSDHRPLIVDFRLTA